MFSDKVLLYPQTFLFPPKLDRAFQYFSQIFLLKLPVSNKKLNFLEKNQLLPKVKCLKIKKISEKDEEVLKKEIKLLQEWGLNFRTPETLKYLMQFKKVTEDSLEEYLSIFKKNEKVNEISQELEKIRYALILLSLAEELDFSLYEVESSLKQVEQKFSEFFEEKIIGENQTFEKILDLGKLEEKPSVVEGLYHLELRILSWKILLPYLNWEEIPSLKALLITEKTLIENWQETSEILEETLLNSDIVFYRLNKPLNEVLGFSKTFSFSFQDETQIFLLK